MRRCRWFRRRPAWSGQRRCEAAHRERIDANHVRLGLDIGIHERAGPDGGCVVDEEVDRVGLIQQPRLDTLELCSVSEISGEDLRRTGKLSRDTLELLGLV